MTAAHKYICDGTNMADVTFLRDGKPIPVEQVIVESMRVTTPPHGLSTRERWLMLRAYELAIFRLANKYGFDPFKAERDFGFDDAMDMAVTEGVSVEMVLAKEAPPP